MLGLLLLYVVVYMANIQVNALNATDIETEPEESTGLNDSVSKCTENLHQEILASQDSSNPNLHIMSMTS